MSDDSRKSFYSSFILPSSAFRSYILLAASLAVALATPLCAAGKYIEAALLAAAVLALGVVLATGASIEAVLIAWFATTPIASFYLRFPAEKSIITYDRAVILFVLLILILKGRNKLSG